MFAEIKRFHSPDVDDVEHFIPDDKESFGFLLQVMIGIKNKDGEESFDIFICTPKWLTSNFNKNEIIFGFHYMIVFEYNFNAIKQKIEKYVNELHADNWEKIAEKLNLIGKWEFFDYKK
jgi:hypothetical protein